MHIDHLDVGDKYGQLDQLNNFNFWQNKRGQPQMHDQAIYYQNCNDQAEVMVVLSSEPNVSASHHHTKDSKLDQILP